jgi:hypothetical protein
MPTKIVVLFFIPPVLAILYRWLEHIGIIDKVTGRGLALDGLKMLKSTSGYPKSWIYNKDEDKRIFTQLEKRISKNTSIQKIQQALKQGHKPKLISTAGNPIELTGLPPEWPQDERFSYLPNQPILYVFDAPGSRTGEKGYKVCTLEELETWLQDEKDNRLFLLGVIALGMVSIALLVLRLSNVS